jgi:hypothetical protein
MHRKYYRYQRPLLHRRLPVRSNHRAPPVTLRTTSTIPTSFYRVRCVRALHPKPALARHPILSHHQQDRQGTLHPRSERPRLCPRSHLPHPRPQPPRDLLAQAQYSSPVERLSSRSHSERQRQRRRHRGDRRPARASARTHLISPPIRLRRNSSLHLQCRARLRHTASPSTRSRCPACVCRCPRARRGRAIGS